MQNKDIKSFSRQVKKDLEKFDTNYFFDFTLNDNNITNLNLIEFKNEMKWTNKPNHIRIKMQIWYGILMSLIILFVFYLNNLTFNEYNLFDNEKLEMIGLFLLLGGISGVIGSIWSWFGKYDKQINGKKVDDIYFIDIWTFGHIIFHIILVLVFNYYLNNFLYSFLISVTIGILWEIGEYILSFIKPLRTIYAEKPINSLGDLLFGGILGSLIAYIFI